MIIFVNCIEYKRESNLIARQEELTINLKKENEQ